MTGMGEPIPVHPSLIGAPPTLRGIDILARKSEQTRLRWADLHAGGFEAIEASAPLSSLELAEGSAHAVVSTFDLKAFHNMGRAVAHIRRYGDLSPTALQ